MLSSERLVGRPLQPARARPRASARAVPGAAEIECLNIVVSLSSIQAEAGPDIVAGGLVLLALLVLVAVRLGPHGELSGRHDRASNQADLGRGARRFGRIGSR